MNRKETKLLVENWRKVLEEGLYNEDPELLNEFSFKNIAQALTAMVLIGSAVNANAEVTKSDLTQVGWSEVENYDEDSSFDIGAMDKLLDAIVKLQQDCDLDDESTIKMFKSYLEGVNNMSTGKDPMTVTDALEFAVDSVKKLTKKAGKAKKARKNFSKSDVQDMKQKLPPETIKMMKRLESSRKQATEYFKK